MNLSGDMYVIGAGGHAKVVLQAIRTLGRRVAAVFDDNPASWNQCVMGIGVVGCVRSIEQYSPKPTVIAVGDNRHRRRLAEQLQCEWTTIVHPNAYVDPSVQIGPGSVILPGAIVQVDGVVGRHAIVNNGCVIDHDCRIGDFAHICPGVCLAGGVTVGEGAMLGIGSVAIPGVRIGAWTTVGAGAAVVRDVPDRVVAMGVPARVKRRLDDIENGPDGPQPNG